MLGYMSQGGQGPSVGPYVTRPQCWAICHKAPVLGHMSQGPCHRELVVLEVIMFVNIDSVEFGVLLVSVSVLLS